MELKTQKGKFSHLVTIIKPYRKKTFFPGKDLDNEVMDSLLGILPKFLFVSIRTFLFPCHIGICMWLTVVAAPKLQFPFNHK